MTFPFARSQASATRMIKRWGGPVKGFIVRNGVKRAAWMARLEFKPSERALVIDGACRFYIATEGVTVGPEQGPDHLEYKGKTYRIVAPVSGPRPNDTIMYYDATVVEFTEG